MNTLVLIILQQKQLTEPFLTSNLALLQSYGPGRYYLFWYPSILGLKQISAEEGYFKFQPECELARTTDLPTQNLSAEQP